MRNKQIEIGEEGEVVTLPLSEYEQLLEQVKLLSNFKNNKCQCKEKEQ